MRKLSMNELNRKTVEEFKQAEKVPVIAVLENIRSVYNVGSVFRTADAFLIQGICICGYTAQPPRKDMDKTALGATETVDWYYEKNALDAVSELKQKGYTVYAVEQTDKSISLENISVNKNSKTALVFGNEVEGLTSDTLAACDACIEIPQFGMKHSLNISVAAGIVFWEFIRKQLLSSENV